MFAIAAKAAERLKQFDKCDIYFKRLLQSSAGVETDRPEIAEVRLALKK